MKLAYIDAVGGAAGDMLLAGFLSAGISNDEKFINRLADDLRLENISFTRQQVRRGGFKSTFIDVKAAGSGALDWHSLKEITSLIENSRLPGEVKTRSIAAFNRLARAEAKAHGESPDDLHLHETGDADAIVEITGTILAIYDLGIDRVICSPLPMGRGMVKCSHGLIPLPAPAVSEMLEGVPVRGADIEGETVTPTGMALVREIASGFGLMPAMTIEGVGAGAGSRDSGKIPNMLRIFMGRSLEEKIEKESAEKNILIETNIDDMPATLYEHIFEKLFESGALDVYTTPILMKRGRPAHKLSILAGPNKVEALLNAVFTETTSTGVRFYEVTKRNIPRRNIEVETPWGKVQVKISSIGRDIVNISPEYEACRNIANRHAIPVKKVIEEITHAAKEKVGA